MSDIINPSPTRTAPSPLPKSEGCFLEPISPPCIEHLIFYLVNFDLNKPTVSENKFEYIYNVVKLIPKGRVSTYGSITEYLGSRGGARLVGWAMNACHGRAGVPVKELKTSIQLALI